MDLEQQLKKTYVERLGALDVPAGDVAAGRRTGVRMRTKRRWEVGVAAVVVVAVAVGGSLLGTGRGSIGPSGSTGHWRELPAPPLSPRAYAESVWTGHEVVVLGGETKPCSPSADCAFAPHDRRDGAAYDPATNTWHRIADAPVAVGPGDRLLSAAGRVVLRHGQQHGSRLFAYDPATDEWSEIPSFLADLPSALGNSVYGFRHGRVVEYDAVRGVWNERIPRDLIRPRLTQRRVTATPYGPVVTGYDARLLNGTELTTRVIADLYDGTSWHRLPATSILGNDWAWAGDRMIDFDSFQHQGMESQAGLSVGGQLDPATGRSSPLPESALETPVDPWSPVAIGPGGWAAGWGLVYDVSSGQAWALPPPEGGAPDLGTTGVWAGDTLLVFGGATFGSDGSAVTNHAWLYTP